MYIIIITGIMEKMYGVYNNYYHGVYNIVLYCAFF